MKKLENEKLISRAEHEETVSTLLEAQIKQAREDAFNEVEGYLRDQHAELRSGELTEFGEGASSAFCQTIAQLKYMKARAKASKERT